MIKNILLMVLGIFLYSSSMLAATQDVAAKINGIDIRTVNFTVRPALRDKVIITLSGSPITLSGCNKSEVFFDAFDTMLPYYFALLISAKETKKEVHFRIDNQIKADSICGVQIVKLL